MRFTLPGPDVEADTLLDLSALPNIEEAAPRLARGEMRRSAPKLFEAVEQARQD